MSIRVPAILSCDYPGCVASINAILELTESRIMDGALGEHMLASVSVLDSSDLKGWKSDTTGQGKCRCPIHNKPQPKGKPVDTSSW